MSSSSSNDGLRNEALRGALTTAIGGRTGALDDLLARMGRADSPRPNLRLAAAFGAEVASLSAASASVVRLLDHLGASDAKADEAAVFLPIAAAYGWVSLLQAGREQERAWSAVAELAADDRTPIRLGTLDALTTFAARREKHPADALLAQALDWLEHEDRQVLFGAAAVVVEVFGDSRTLSALTHPELLLDYLSRAIDAIADAPRAAERSDARRRLLLALPRTLGAVVSSVSRGDRGVEWLDAECTRARHPDVREALSNTLARFAARDADPGAVVAQRLRRALEGSAKPPRDPTRRRPGAARGKASRPVR
jgi:hypothetical protein